ncbi:hypothetical protein DICPUDRAFT_39284 [Dictyostelium purpureum]|uniref:Era-type G domain-containing protein n=1 Tax=Dictyostelium purpureum TaxID=5786 RepID=F0ZW32_DICPU|nr:uncharacterized protein DICPUDRAFT_39284 [Dictyostelium purpureum]EGC31850.1 hypothetical protein DICPUDRAFT_39284 [Dictyostelium purpureum]|eukprot:XP_003291620.1 hypothetical protein DICPUDRAFT_39284 [Dictyostelium purpureum]
MIKSITKIINYNNFNNNKNIIRCYSIMKKRYGFEDPIQHQLELINQKEEELRQERSHTPKYKRVVKTHSITPPNLYNTESFRVPPPRKNAKKLNIAVIGAPNAGKSTLVNAIVGEKVCAVSHIEHTTRDAILGVYTEGDTQLLFNDTPGMIKNFNKNTNVREFVNLAWTTVKESDLVLMVVDATNNNQPDTKYIINHLEDQMIELLKKAKLEDIENGEIEDEKDFILVINKVDLVRKKEDLVELISELNEGNIFSDTFVVSATNNVKLDSLKEYLVGKAKLGQWIFEEEVKTDQTDIFRASEIIKEKLYSKLKDEIPYKVIQSTRGWTPTKDGALRIDQDFIVTKASHKSLILGKDGSVIKSIYLEAKKDLEKVFNKRVHLFLTVKEKQSTEHYELVD